MAQKNFSDNIFINVSYVLVLFWDAFPPQHSSFYHKSNKALCSISKFWLIGWLSGLCSRRWCPTVAGSAWCPHQRTAPSTSSTWPSLSELVSTNCRCEHVISFVLICTGSISYSIAVRKPTSSSTCKNVIFIPPLLRQYLSLGLKEVKV